MPRPPSCLVWVAPPVEHQRLDQPFGIQAVLDVDRRVPKAVVGADVRVVVGGPAHPKARQQRGWNPDRLCAASSASTSESLYHPFGGEITGQRTFDGLTIPSARRLGWHFGTDRWPTDEFFRFEITTLQLPTNLIRR